jgi:YidC/Oxa1 family membrane protein insertase
MFETLIVQPIFNLLVLIYALLPGHDFGISVIIFTVLIRFLMWPLLKKQLHQTKLMRDLQPDIKRIKERTKGDRQQEAQLLMELYKERGVSPFGSIGLLLIQLPILLGLFQGLSRLADEPQTVINLSYDWVLNLGWMQQVSADIGRFDETLLGFVDLTRNAFGELGFYLPAFILAAAAGLFQYFQTKQLSPNSGDARTIRQILKDEANGKRADQAEINAAMGRNMRYVFPLLTFVIAASFPGALALYWATGSLVGIVQQRSVLNTDVAEMEAAAEKTPVKKTKPARTKKPKSAKQRRNR